MFNFLKAYLETKANFTPADFKEVEKRCTYLSLAKGEKLLERGTVWQHHAFVCRGLARGYQTDVFGNEKTTVFAPENYWTGDRESLLTGEPAEMCVVAETDADFILITQDDYNTLCVTLAPFSEFMSNLVQRNLASRQNYIFMPALSDAEKVQQFLQKYPTVPARTSTACIASFLDMDVKVLEILLIDYS
ncbi:MAG: Crp/Fnr family transcriptional regulator [Flavobacterium sp.]